MSSGRSVFRLGRSLIFSSGSAVYRKRAFGGELLLLYLMATPLVVSLLIAAGFFIGFTVVFLMGFWSLFCLIMRG